MADVGVLSTVGCVAFVHSPGLLCFSVQRKYHALRTRSAVATLQCWLALRPAAKQRLTPLAVKDNACRRPCKYSRCMEIVVGAGRTSQRCAPKDLASATGPHRQLAVLQDRSEKPKHDQQAKVSRSNTPACDHTPSCADNPAANGRSRLPPRPRC